MRALVTGAGGVIGTALTKQLRHRGYEVVGVDRAAGADIHLDLSRPRDQWPSFPEPEVIFHLAASFERSTESWKFWEVNWRDNIAATHNVLSLAQEWPRLRTFIFASSYLVYNPSAYLTRGGPAPLRETSDLCPRNLCGAAKLYGERALEFIADYHPRLRPISARIFRVYGKGSRDVISRWIRAGLKGLSIEVYNRNDSFSYIYAGDVAEALIRLAESDFGGGPVNVASSKTHTIDNVLQILGQHFELDIQDVEVQHPREQSWGRIGKLQKICNWSPLCSLAGGIARCVRYEREHA